MTNSLALLRSIIDRSRSFVLTTHMNPDGDGLGSECAVARYLKRHGKNVRIINHSATPANLRFLSALFPIETFEQAAHSEAILTADAIFVLDTNHPDRLASMKPFYLENRGAKVCIDHHPDPAEFKDLCMIDEASSATGEILYRVLRELDADSIDAETATALYAAIMTDTGSFRFPKTDPEVHAICSDLLARGADPVRIYEELYERGPVGRLRLLGMVLSQLTLAHGGKVAWFSVTKEMFAQTGTAEPDTDAFVPYALGVDGVQIGLMFTELDGLVKVSFRSKGSIPVNALAREFGGNGHLNAAGARVSEARLEELIPRVLERAGAYVL
jgi:phosphoesterase RecJ-like protein